MPHPKKKKSTARAPRNDEIEARHLADRIKYSFVLVCSELAGYGVGHWRSADRGPPSVLSITRGSATEGRPRLVLDGAPTLSLPTSRAGRFIELLCRELGILTITLSRMEKVGRPEI